LSNAPARTPKQVADRFNVRDLPLSPTEGFILSRVDGALDELQITAVTGLSEEVVLGSLRRLESLGLIVFDEGRQVSTISLAPPKSSDAPTESVDPRPTHSSVRNLRAPEDEAVLSENVDLDPETRRLVVETYRTLGRLDHYALLKVEPTVDRKALKRAYYDLASKFHPDRYFRKNLGSYKLRIEAIFDRITLAHDTLTDKERRADYDAYIGEQRRARGIEDLLADAEAEAKRVEERIERDAREQERLANRSTPAPPPAPDGVPSPSMPPGGHNSAADVTGRREALAKRLLGGRAVRSSAPPTNGAASNSTMSTADAVQSLRHRYEERVSRARTSLANKYRNNAQESLAAGDPVAAANAFRVALTLSPNDSELAQLARAAQARADGILSATYARQAGYEEKNGHWVDAARSWARVVRASPTDAGAHERTANALVKAEGNLHEAARLAQLACSMEPANSTFRVTLANVYVAAGLTLNARRELETAAQLAPHDATIDALFRRIAKREGRQVPGL